MQIFLSSGVIALSPLPKKIVRWLMQTEIKSSSALFQGPKRLCPGKVAFNDVLWHQTTKLLSVENSEIPNRFKKLYIELLSSREVMLHLTHLFLKIHINA